MLYPFISSYKNEVTQQVHADATVFIDAASEREAYSIVMEQLGQNASPARSALTIDSLSASIVGAYLKNHKVLRQTPNMVVKTADGYLLGAHTQNTHDIEGVLRAAKILEDRSHLRNSLFR
ncbi:hypothetical protein [Neptuniibacter sp. QD37_11]|uniref:hypothetical protein n=1 Tax=Neptuniibacter sp. QD37_11 TaxID=3398209 RepID=UPI0039F539B9